MPQWVQLAGILIGVPVVLIVAWQVWKHRVRFRAWLTTRSRGYKIALAGAVAVVIFSAGGTGLVGYHYVMHDNDFCASCHIMDNAWNRFQVSAHKSLTCHECHRQSMLVSSKELFWWVLERRMAVPAHDKVPTKICAECHLQSTGDSSRKNVMLTAGHVVHFKSDSSALKNLQCTTCHGRDFHKFTPNNATCAQSGCHTERRIQLGEMSKAGFMHCTVCHSFRNRVADSLDVKKAGLAMSPKTIQCFSCHAMGDQMSKFDLSKDPHRGGCGSCHNPHKQSEPKDAYKSCTTCHSNADTLTAFHRGLGAHATNDCGTCHKPHSWKVKGVECLACHKNIFDDRPSLKKAAVPVKPVDEELERPHGPFVADGAAAEEESLPPPPPQDTAKFLHSRHRAIACSQCHGSNDTHGRVKITNPEGCRGCHHAATQKMPCETCHTKTLTAARPVSVTMRITARKDPAVTRTLSFEHTRHGALQCSRCHVAGAKREAVVSCASCHADHHLAQRNCASCHPTARTGHDRTSHEGCTTCHTGPVAAMLTQSRPLCLTCHEAQRNHEPKGECSTCHLVSVHPGKPS